MIYSSPFPGQASLENLPGSILLALKSRKFVNACRYHQIAPNVMYALLTLVVFHFFFLTWRSFTDAAIARHDYHSAGIENTRSNNSAVCYVCVAV